MGNPQLACEVRAVCGPVLAEGRTGPTPRLRSPSMLFDSLERVRALAGEDYAVLDELGGEPG